MPKFLKLVKSNYNDIIKPIAVLLAICIIIPLALAFTNKITKNRIADLEEKNRNATMELLIEADSFSAKKYVGEKAEFEYFTAVKDQESIGYIFTTSAKGYGGEVSVMTAVNPDGTVKEIAILDVSDETPGLGQNATSSSFYGQFAGKTNNISAVKNSASDDKNEINALTGATITSKAVTNAVNQALENYSLITAEEVVTDEK